MTEEIHQIEFWNYILKRKKSTPTIAKHFGISMSRANHSLQKLANFGHATSKREGLCTYWKAIPDSPPRQNARSRREQDDRRDDVLTAMMFNGVVSNSFIRKRTGLTQYIVKETLLSLQKDGFVVKVGTKMWKAVM